MRLELSTILNGVQICCFATPPTDFETIYKGNYKNFKGRNLCLSDYVWTVCMNDCPSHVSKTLQAERLGAKPSAGPRWANAPNGHCTHLSQSGLKVSNLVCILNRKSSFTRKHSHTSYRWQGLKLAQPDVITGGTTNKHTAASHCYPVPAFICYALLSGSCIELCCGAHIPVSGQVSPRRCVEDSQQKTMPHLPPLLVALLWSRCLYPSKSAGLMILHWHGFKLFSQISKLGSPAVFSQISCISIFAESATLSVMGPICAHKRCLA